MTTYCFKKPKEWDVHKEWVELIVILSAKYPVTAGQIGPDMYEMDVRVDDPDVNQHIKSVSRRGIK